MIGRGRGKFIMTEAVLRISGNVLSASTVVAIERGLVSRATMAMVARRVGVSLIKPKLYKAIPYVGWAIAIGTTLYAGYEAYNATHINYHKMENDIYDEKDMKAFRRGYTESVRVFAQTSVGAEILRQRTKFILIPAEAMPIIATVDTVGMQQFGNTLTWDPANGPSRRATAISGRGPAGPFAYTNGNTVRGSWEEYPFAVTQGPTPGTHVDRAPLRENWIQGGFIRAAAIVQAFRPGETVNAFILA